jgi:ABC-type antimicrobial peptide transport system permease subunit
VGTHTVQVASFSHGLTVDPWFSDNPDLVQLVIRYGGSNGLTSASSVPIYQAAKISEGNVAVAVFAIGAISALLATLAVVSVFSKEVHEGRRRLGILRTIGASSSAVRWLVFPQALGSGLAGAAVGAVLGVASALVLAGSGVFMVFGHRLELSMDPTLLASVLLGAVLISVSSALVSAELAVRETIVSSIKRLPNEGPPPVDVDELLGDD